MLSIAKCQDLDYYEVEVIDGRSPLRETSELSTSPLTARIGIGQDPVQVLP